MILIIDASVGLKWLVQEDDTEIANQLVGSGARLLVPVLFHAEVGNALWKRVRRGEVAAHVVVQLLVDVRSLVEVFEEVSVMPAALKIATAIDHPIYDCVYVALADAVDDILITADAKFMRKIERTAFARNVRLLS